MKRMQAYLTVEAALVMPLVMGVLMMTVFLFVYQYDRCQMEQDVGMLALYAGTLAAEDGKELTERIGRRAAERDAEKYVCWTQKKIDVTVRKDRVEIAAEGGMNVPLPEWNLTGSNKSWSAKVTRRMSRLSPVEVIRLGRRLRRSG